MKHLAPKTVRLFFFQDVVAFIILYLTFGLFFGSSFAFALFQDSNINTLFTVGIIVNFILFLFVILFSIIWAKLRYKNYKYELREDGFRKESGVIWKKYVTIPYERIQNVDIYRGILARLFGLSDLHIQTAGNSAASGRYGFGGSSEGRLPGLTIKDAESIRDELIKRSRGQKINQSQGGQPSQPSPQPNPQTNQGL